MNRENMMNRLENDGYYEAVYNDSEGRQIVVIRSLDLYEFVSKLIKLEREKCAKRAEAYAYMSDNFNALAEEIREMGQHE